MPSSSSGKRWWRRAADVLKDQCSLCVAKGDLEVALIKATSHDASCVDHKNVGRVFAWAKTSSSSSSYLPALLSRRVHQTRSWAVALKGLLLAHGLLLCFPTSHHRLPFDLSRFRDASSPPAFSAFVRAYFAFLSHRSSSSASPHSPPTTDPEMAHLRGLLRMQDQLDLLMQVRPYGGGHMSSPLVLEAMDCVVVEIFDLYSGVCNGIAHALVTVFGSSSFWKEEEGVESRKGLVGVRVLRRAREQSARLTRYFEVCRSLGVLNASELPPVVDSIPEEDIEELERFVAGEGEGDVGNNEGGGGKVEEKVIGDGSLRTVVTREWVVFDGEQSGSSSRSRMVSRNPFLCSGTPWELQPVYSHHSLCHHHHGVGVVGASLGGGGWESRDLLAL